MNQVAAPPLPAYTPPSLVTYSAAAWQAKLIKLCEGLHDAGKTRIVTVIVGNGPPRWFVGVQQGAETR